MAVWWDGDLLQEVLDKTYISKYDWEQKRFIPFIEFEGVASNNSTKSYPLPARRYHRRLRGGPFPLGRQQFPTPVCINNPN